MPSIRPIYRQSTSALISACPTEPAQDEREAPEVVAVLYKSGDVLTAEECGIALEVCAKVETPLMTVTQHKRIVASLTGPAQTEQQPIGVTAVAVTRENDDGELCLDWLLEGGIAELEFAGQVLIVADQPITDDEGSGEVYAGPIAQTAQGCK